MNPIFSRTLKALCTIVVAGVLTACGSSSTVDPFKPTRVIGLGDAYNDMTGPQSTVRGTLAEVGVTTVVEQLAVLFGGGATVTSSASSSYVAGNLTTQASALNALTSSDLIVITAGTKEFVTGGDAAAAAFLVELKSVLDTLKGKGAKHILIMSIVDISVAGNYANPVTFNGTISAGLGSYSDIARYVNINRPNAYFPGWSTAGPGATAYCTSPSTLDGCAFGDTAQTADVSTFFLADNLNPTPAGNRWIAQYLYYTTAQGWR